MRAALRILPATVAAAAVLTACGSSSSSSSSGPAPKQATIAPLQKVTSTSVRYSLSGQLNFDSSKVKNLPSDVVHEITNAFGGSGLSLSASGQQESATRTQLTMTVKPVLSKPLVVIVYDGSFYYSLDDGKTFGSGGSLSSITGGLAVTPDAAQKLFASLPDGAFSDGGRSQVDGATVEHYTAQISRDQLISAIAGVASPGSQAQQNLQQLTQFIQPSASSVDAYVRTDNGELQRYTVHLDFGFDIGAIVNAFAGGAASSATGVPTGLLGITVQLGVDYKDYGAAITIQRPTVDPHAPKLPSGLGGLGGLIGG